MRFLPLLVLNLALISATANAEIRQQQVSYEDGKETLTGYLYWDDAVSGKRPGVMVVHEWWGLNDYARQRARMLAKAGYVAFAADMYGTGKVSTHASDAKGWMKQITANRDAWQQRAALGLAELKRSPYVDADRLAAIGYCFGGATVMQMAYAGLDVNGVVSFHGSLPPATTAEQKNIRAKILVEHGADDGFVPAQRIENFKQALTAAGADWTMHVHPGAKHGFTNPAADQAGIDGLAYNQTADEKSWQSMQRFLADIFR